MESKLEQQPQGTPFEGGPGQELPQELESQLPTAPSIKKVKLAGKEFEVNPDLASALEEREREFSRKLSEQGNELGRLRQDIQRLAPPQPQLQHRVIDFDRLIFENPTQALQLYGQSIKDELRAEYTQEQQAKSFWDGFYRSHKDLDAGTDDLLVKTVLQQHWNSLAPLDPQEASSRLAELTRQAILAYSNRFKTEGEIKTLPQGRARAEASSTTRAPAPSAQEEPPGSLGAVLKVRREARRKAQRGQVSG